MWRSFEGFARLLNITRESPLPHAGVTYTSDGTPIRMLPGNRVELGHAILPDAFTPGARIVAQSFQELRHILETKNDRQNLGIDVEATMASAAADSHYPDEPIKISGGDWGLDVYRSLVKSALALVYHAGHDPVGAEIAIGYLAGDDEKRCFFPYYNRDLLSGRELGTPINCVYVKGDSSSHELMAYVEIFGILRSVIRLSERYQGDDFEHQYTFDPSDGLELDVAVELNSAILSDAEQETDYLGEKTGALANAIGAVVQKAQAIANGKELQRIAISALDDYFAGLGKGPDDPLTEGECQAAVDHVVRSVLPFIEYLNRPLKLPDHVLKQLYENS